MAAKNDEKKIDPAVAAFAQAKLDDAWKLREEYEEFIARRKANREQMRNLLTSGDLTEDQAAEVMELYPERQRRESVTEEPASA